tara:strand:+ start:1686 stop:3125 length:1440 start_codon:yes stop_codon:yes gene_type:complete
MPDFPLSYYYVDNKTNQKYILAKVNTNRLTMVSTIDTLIITEFNNQKLFDKKITKCMSSYNFFPQIINSLKKCFPELNNNDMETLNVFNQDNYTNYILLTLEDIINSCNGLSLVPNIGGFLTVEFNKDFAELYDYNKTPIKVNYIWNVCKGINIKPEVKGICSLMINILTQNKCNVLPYILNVNTGNYAAIQCYSKSSFVPLINTKTLEEVMYSETDKYMIRNDYPLYYSNFESPIDISTEHTFILICHGSENPNSKNTYDFPYKNISFYAYCGNALSEPIECHTDKTMIKYIPQATCYKLFDTVDTVTPDNNNIKLRDMNMSVSKSDIDLGYHDIMGLYHCNYNTKIYDWNNLLTRYNESSFNYEDLFDDIDEYCENNNIPLKNVVLKMWVCRSQCGVNIQSQYQYPLRSSTRGFIGGNNKTYNDTPIEMTEDELFKYLKCENKPKSGGRKRIKKSNKKKTKRKISSKSKRTRKNKSK